MNFGWITVISFCVSVQMTFGLMVVLSQVKAVTRLSFDVLPEWQDLIKPEWETVGFRFFVLAAVVMQGFFLHGLRERIDDPVSRNVLRNRAAREIVVTLLMVALGFKIAVYEIPQGLALALCAGLLAVCAAHHLFARHIEAVLTRSWEWLVVRQRFVVLECWVGRLFPALLFFLIYVPDVKGMMARFFIGEQFHHNDSFIFGPVWAYLCKERLNVDVISQYGVGLPALVGQIASQFKPVTYEHIAFIMMAMVIIYYVGWFLLLKRWFESPLVAIAVALYGMKIQMFNNGVYPFSLTYGSATVLRFWWDVPFFFALTGFMRTHARRWIFLAAAFVGVQIFYVTSEGVYLAGALGVFLCMYVVNPYDVPRKGTWWGRALLAVGACVVMAAVAWALFFSCVGTEALGVRFWSNMGEFIEYFLSGFGVTPMMQSLVDQKFLASFMGFLMPIFYVGTFLVVGSCWLLKRIAYRHGLMAVMAVYGLGLYHYYVARSAPSSYYVVALPFAVLLGFWALVIIKRLQGVQQIRFKLIVVILSTGALATTHLFFIYPNAFCLLRQPFVQGTKVVPLDGGKPYFHHLWHDFRDEFKVPVNSLGKVDEGLMREDDFTTDAQLVSYYEREMDLSADAALISALTSPQEPAVLISSFEVRLLMQANRKPFFYYFPLVISRPLGMRNFVRISIYTTEQLQKTLAQFEKEKPQYVFMERILLTRPVPDYFYGQYSSLMYLTDYILSRYSPARQGKYLVALKRKEHG